MPCFFKDDVQLTNYATTKSDKKKHISRIPTDPPQLMDDFGYQQILDADKKEITDNPFKPVYSRDMSEANKMDQDSQSKQLDVQYSDFQMIMALGTNALGRVLLVEHKDTGEWFALKSIRKDEILTKDDDEI